MDLLNVQWAALDTVPNAEAAAINGFEVTVRSRADGRAIWAVEVPDTCGVVDETDTLTEAKAAAIEFAAVNTVAAVTARWIAEQS